MAVNDRPFGTNEVPVRIGAGNAMAKYRWQ